MKFITLALLGLSLPANAGKLAEGFRGIPFGPATALESKPLENCAPSTEQGVKWKCDTEIGGVPVSVAYGVDHGIYYVTLIGFQIGYAEAAKFREVLTAAYGPGTPASAYRKGALDDWYWRDGSVFASFEYNQFSHKVSFVILDTGLSKKVTAAQEAAAKQSVDDL